MSGHMQLLELDLSDKAAHQTTLSPIHDAMSQAVSLTRNLLAFGRRQTLHPEALDFGTVVQEQVALLQGLMGTRVQLEFTLRDNPMVWADRNQLQQVLMNLIVNARDAMPDGGTVHVSVVTKQLSGQEDLRLAELPAGRYALLECKDTGSGISAEHLDRIFDPFFTTKPQDKGTGLGLSTVIGIVRQHGGGITVDSPQGGGARFSVYLPLHQSEEQQQETDAVRNAGKGELLLVVEDETAVREWLTDLLTRNGYRVSAAANGEDALTLISEASERFDLAVMDVGLPGLSGVETFQRLREWKPDLPVVFCSGWQNEADESFIRESNLPLLTKPFPHVQLLKLIRSTLAPPMDGASAGQP